MKARFWPTMLSAAALTAASLVAAPSAQAADPPAKWQPATILYAKVVKADRKHVHVKARYRCFGDNNEKTHVFVSVKQGPKISKMSLEQLAIESEGTSAISKAWYNTNVPAPGKQPANITANCDGKFHTGLTIRRQAELTDENGKPIRSRRT